MGSFVLGRALGGADLPAASPPGPLSDMQRPNCSSVSSLQYGTTLLMVASYAGHIDCVRELVLQGADINLQREVGQVLHLSKKDPGDRCLKFSR